jgi:alpha-amylase
MYEITQAFQSTKGRMVTLAKRVYELSKGCRDVTVLGSFIENQDLPRFASRTKDMSLAKNAIAYNMLQDGIPISKFPKDTSLNQLTDSRSLLWTRAALFGKW